MGSAKVATVTEPLLTTGTPVLDDLIDGVRVGDNLVVVADDASVLKAVGLAFGQAVANAEPLVVVAFGQRGVDIAPSAGHLLDLRHEGEGSGSPTHLLENADEEVGAGAAFLIDSLDGVQRRWHPDAALEVFLTICPRLYRRRSVAMWLLDSTAHDREFMDRIAQITQVVVRLSGSSEHIEAEVVVAAGRAPTVVGRHLRLQLRAGVLQGDGPLSPGRPRLGEAIRRNRLARGLSQVELARRVGITPSGLSQVEREVRGLAGDTLIRIWEALGVPFGPQDGAPQGYRLGRRSAHAPTSLAEGATGRAVMDDPDIGRCWQIDVDPGAAGSRPLFDGKLSESIVVTQGVLELELEGKRETLQEGDSIVASHAVIQAWANPGPGTATAFWYVLR